NTVRTQTCARGWRALPPTPCFRSTRLAGSTGLEPATSGLTVQCANQAAPRARNENVPLYHVGSRPVHPGPGLAGRRGMARGALELGGPRELRGVAGQQVGDLLAGGPVAEQVLAGRALEPPVDVQQ